MSDRELNRLLDLLGKLSEQEWMRGRERDAIALIRAAIQDHQDSHPR